jgi:rubrerythrin
VVYCGLHLLTYSRATDNHHVQAKHSVKIILQIQMLNTVQSILEKAIEKEIEAQDLYSKLSQTVKDEAARDVFQQLSKVEKTHEELLRKYLRGELGAGALNREQVLDYRIAEHLELPPITPDMKLNEVLLLAANREKAAHELYQSLAGEHPQGEVKRLIEQLASQELEHKQRVEFLYTEVAFPQTDGG